MTSEANQTPGPVDTFERELRRAASLLADGRFEQAHTWAVEALNLRPAHLLAQNLLGLILYQQRRFAPALSLFEELVRKNPDVVTLRMNAGLAALHGGEIPRAVEHLHRAVDLDAGHRRAFTALALAHIRQGETHLARAALLEANQLKLAGRLAEPVQPASVKQVEADLCVQAEELPLSVDMTPCEGFAEVGALALATASSTQVAPPTSAATDPSSRLAETLAGLVLGPLAPSPGSAAEDTEFVARDGVVVAPLRGSRRGLLLRPDGLVLVRGALHSQPANRRRKGAEAEPFLVSGCTLQVFSGEGLVILRAADSAHMQVLHLDKEALYLRERVLLAASAELQWENGRLPGSNEEGSRLVHLHGTGDVVIASTTSPVTLPFKEGEIVRTRFQHLLGWVGSAVPQPADDGLVGFSGTGVLLLQLLEPRP